jgi:bisanhydrobacterioruberin hydratase
MLTSSYLKTSEKSISRAIVFMAIMYSVGIIGFISKIHPDFPLLTPFNLMLSLGMCLAFHPEKNKNFLLACTFIAAVGFAVEAIGVNTGKIFGHYQYGRTLGFKLWETPLSISINWLLTSYCAAMSINQTASEKVNIVLKAFLATLLMVGLDFLIEPVAMKTDMWQWQNSMIPLQNYIGWFLTALPLQIVLFYSIGSVKNKVAFAVFILQALFFLILNIAF